MEVTLKEIMRSHLHTLQRLQLLVDLFGVDWSKLWLQEQNGSVVLTPDINLCDFAGVLSNVEHVDELARKMAVMERATWEAYALIRARMDVEAALDTCCVAHGLPPAGPATSRGGRAAARGTGGSSSASAEARRRSRVSPAAVRSK
uniref:Uncharacterized protein n=1 Tax=Haptolina brevifila TaxID=156173 RepID=A0A7S2I564_9EUKA